MVKIIKFIKKQRLKVVNHKEDQAVEPQSQALSKVVLQPKSLLKKKQRKWNFIPEEAVIAQMEHTFKSK